MSQEDQDQQFSLSMRELSATYTHLLTLQEEIISLIKQEEERLERLNKEDIHKINSTVSKIPEYQEKLQGIVKMMASIDKMSRKLKKRTTYVQERQQTPTERS